MYYVAITQQESIGGPSELVVGYSNRHLGIDYELPDTVSDILLFLVVSCAKRAVGYFLDGYVQGWIFAIFIITHVYESNTQITRESLAVDKCPDVYSLFGTVYVSLEISPIVLCSSCACQ